MYRVSKKDPETPLDIKCINKFGKNEVGVVKWNQFDEKTKREYVKQHVKSIVNNKQQYEQRMHITGFSTLTKYFETIMVTENQINLLMNHIQYDLSQITDYTTININNYIKTYRTIKLRL